MAIVQDLTGQRFGMLVIVRFSHYDKNRNKHWRCRCDCGTEKTIRSSHFKTGPVVSCGCRMRVTMKTHGGTGTPEHATWASIIQRCHNPSATQYCDYGGRGIKICPEWRESFAAFLAHVGPRPSANHSIDRYPNHDGDYEPGNVRWATRSEQQNNRRVNVWMEIDGERKTLAQWTSDERCEVGFGTLRYRVKHWPHNLAILKKGSTRVI